MKYIITFWLVLLLHPITSAQSDTTYYFSKSGGFSIKEIADSYKKTKLIDSVNQLYSFEEYSIEGTLKSNGSYLRNDFSLKTGVYTTYYENGKKNRKGHT